MAERQATNVLDAVNIIKGLMTKEESAPVENVPTETQFKPL